MFGGFAVVQVMLLRTVVVDGYSLDPLGLLSCHVCPPSPADREACSRSVATNAVVMRYAEQKCRQWHDITTMGRAPM